MQIWILPEAAGIKPGYEQKTLGDRPRGKLSLVASHAGGDGALKIHQDADLYIGALTKGQAVEKDLAKGRSGYVHVARGKLDLNGIALGEGDGAKIKDESRVKFSATEDAEVLLFDFRKMESASETLARWARLVPSLRGTWSGTLSSASARD